VSSKKKKKSKKNSDLSALILLITLLIMMKMPDLNLGMRIAKDKKWPCVGYYTITSGYGKRNTGIPFASTNHKGIDIGCPVGTEIISVLDGTVLATGYNKYRGYYIMINHGNGVVTIYQHCSQNSFKVSTGQSVIAGQVIVLSGNSGVSSGPHLHFEVKVNGNNVNPKTWLKSL